MVTRIYDQCFPFHKNFLGRILVGLLALGLLAYATTVQAQQQPSSTVAPSPVAGSPNGSQRGGFYNFLLKDGDISAGAFGQFSRKADNGSTNQTTNSSAGALFELRKSYRWWLGYDLNYGYTRLTEHYAYDGNFLQGSQSVKNPRLADVQANMHEVSIEEVFQSPKLVLGMKPFGEGGFGGVIFSPSDSTTTAYSYDGSTLTGATSAPGFGPHGQTKISGQTNFLGIYGVGVNLPKLPGITDRLGARFEYRSLWYTTPSFNSSFEHTQRTMQTQEPAFSIFYKFR